MKKTAVQLYALLEKTMVALLAIGLVTTVFYGVVVRYLPISGKQMAWSQEVAQLLLVWFAFFSIAMVERKTAHFSVEVLRWTKKGIGKFAVGALVAIVTAGFFIFVAINAVRFTASLSGDVSSVLHFPMLLYPCALAICSVLGAIFACCRLIKALFALGARA